MGIFNRFSLPSKKAVMLPEFSVSATDKAVPYKTLATFELKLTEPKFYGDLPETVIKFYPSK